MPELPEVETIRRTIARHVEQTTITDMTIVDDKVIHPLTVETFKRRVIDRTVAMLDRRGKYIVVVFKDDSRLVIDLRMTGRLLLRPSDTPIDRHTRAIFHLNNNQTVRFDDVRRFGRIRSFDDETEMEDALRLGPEPFDDTFTVSTLQRIVEGRTRSIKSLLLDQRILSGLGNIYADEALFVAKIAPNRPAGSLHINEVKALKHACRHVLEQGIRYRGTTLRDYVDGDGRPGEFGDRLQVYGRDGKRCFTCETTIKREKIVGRSSHYCPTCQR